MNNTTYNLADIYRKLTSTTIASTFESNTNNTTHTTIQYATTAKSSK